MNLYTSEGLAMIDTKDPYTWNTRRVNYACSVERTDRPEPLTLGERIALALIYAASVFIVFAMIGWGFEVLTGIEWETVAQLLGVKR